MEDVQNSIFYDLGGGNSDNDCIDICEMVAIILIPFFVKNIKGDLNQSAIDDGSNFAGKAFATDSQLKTYIDDLQECTSMVSKLEAIDHVLKIILMDSTGSDEPRRITPELIKVIFARYGEGSLIEDEELLDQMVFDSTS